MSKKKKETLTIDKNYAIISAAQNLIKAEDIASISGDLEVLLATSDRWMNIYATIAELETAEKRFGFVPEKLGEQYGGENSSEGSDTSKSGFKIRKKSR